jgi:hypothetical protein
VAMDSDGNMFVAYTWQDEVSPPGPWAMGFARHIAQDSSWVYPATIIGDLDATRVVHRPPALMLDSAGDAHLAWTQTNQTTGDWSIMYMKSLDWHTCVGTPSVAIETSHSDRFIRAMCPEGCGSGGAYPFKAVVTVKDTSSTASVPMPCIPADSVYVRIYGDMAYPDTCTAQETIGGSATHTFWCASNDSLTASQPTNADGEAEILHAAASGTGRLRVEPHTGVVQAGQEDTVWVNSFDQIGGPDGVVQQSDFAAFSTAYTQWTVYGIQNWKWDFVSSEGDACETGETMFKVSGPDYSCFATHYLDEKPSCD